MKIETRDERGITVLELRGKITIGEGSIELSTAVADAVRDGSRKIVLNMVGVTEMDSAGIGELGTARVAVEKAGGRLKLASLPPKVTDILARQDFETYDDEIDAITSF